MIWISYPFIEVIDNITKIVLIINGRGLVKGSERLKSDLSVGEILNSAYEFKKRLLIIMSIDNKSERGIASWFSDIELFDITWHNGRREM